ncbi:MAG: hypothetical protein VW378_07920 [bacterium]
MSKLPLGQQNYEVDPYLHTRNEEDQLKTKGLKEYVAHLESVFPLILNPYQDRRLAQLSFLEK